MEIIEESPEHNITPEEVHKLMVEKAGELFSLCDKEMKGFITKRDMQRLRADFPLTPDQLEDVFDNLDEDHNGYLTLKEFTEGFGAFLGITAPKAPSPKSESLTDEQKNANVGTNKDEDEAEQEELFQSLLDHIGGHATFGENADVKNMWCEMRKENPSLLKNFEDFLGRVNRETKQSKADYANLEEAYKIKSNIHENHIKQLYDEMEVEIGNEKERLLAEEYSRELKIREELEAELKDKDSILQDVLLKHKQMEETLFALNVAETETKQENVKLQREKDKLEQKLENSTKIIEEMREHTDKLRKNASEEKRNRARAALQATEGIALERETLVRQLDVLKSLNQKLIDEKDESLLKNTSNERRGERMSDILDEDLDSTPAPKPRRLLEKRGSTLGDYFDDSSRIDKQHPAKRLDSIADKSELTDFECDYDDAFYDKGEAVKPKDLNIANNLNLNVSEYPKLLNNAKLPCNGVSDTGDDNNNKTNNFKQQQIFINNSEIIVERKNENGSTSNLAQIKNTNIEPTEAISITTPETSPKSTWKIKHGIYPAALENTDHLDTEDYWKVQKTFYTRKSVENEEHEISEEETLSSQRQPERVFKIVFIGDSCVGKTSFINRFCKDSFDTHFSATIGVDFQVKSMNFEGQTIALQLWDTAGQERYRSITKQYFRRADGVVVMFDITSETSFKNLRLWVQNIQDVAADEHIVMLLIGNKIDLCTDDESRKITLKEAERLADEFHALHYEVSAKTGESVYRSMEALTGLLQEKEDEEIEKVLKLNEPKRKSKCCKT